jgi:hypothetical protein
MRMPSAVNCIQLSALLDDKVADAGYGRLVAANTEQRADLPCLRAGPRQGRRDPARRCPDVERQQNGLWRTLREAAV